MRALEMVGFFERHMIMDEAGMCNERNAIQATIDAVGQRYVFVQPKPVIGVTHAHKTVKKPM